METTVENKIVYEMRMFKSYYVVWKRYYESDGGTDVVEFKSYYVVWKPSFVFLFSLKSFIV